MNRPFRARGDALAASRLVAERCQDVATNCGYFSSSVSSLRRCARGATSHAKSSRPAIDRAAWARRDTSCDESCRVGREIEAGIKVDDPLVLAQRIGTADLGECFTRRSSRRCARRIEGGGGHLNPCRRISRRSVSRRSMLVIPPPHPPARSCLGEEHQSVTRGDRLCLREPHDDEP